jgi:glycosidase
MEMSAKPANQNLVIYCIYVRAHSKAGTFAAVENDLQRIKDLHVDLIWFLPIHPIGKLNAKGSMGCPYSISDYRAVNPEYGTLKDFKSLLAAAHALGLKVMIDVVYHHTAHDSNLIADHPDWYRQDEKGVPVASVPVWTDIIDLKHPHPQLSQYLIESLQYWVDLGVDGFRCDVAPLLPLSFWQQAVAHFRTRDRNVIWLAESLYTQFVRDRRTAGLAAHSDCELYSAFDITYDYDIWPIWKAVALGKLPLQRYADMLAVQDAIFPNGFCKLRCVENHDQQRIMRFAPTREQALAWTAFQAFNRGAFLIFGGQESEAEETPSLVESEPVEWGDYELSAFLRKLTQLKKDDAQVHGRFALLSATDALQACWLGRDYSHYGVFNVSRTTQPISVQLPDGIFIDMLSDEQVEVKGGTIAAPETGRILRINSELNPRTYVPEYWDYEIT